MNDTKVVETKKIDFEQPVTLTGDVTLRDGGFRVWLGHSLGTVNGGRYDGTQIVTTGKGLGYYVKRDGVEIGTVFVDLADISIGAIEALERIEKEGASA